MDDAAKRAKEITFGRVPEDEEPDTIIFGCDGLFWGRIVGSADCTAGERLATLREAIREGVPAQPAMAWTKEPPTQPGLYFVRAASAPVIGVFAAQVFLNPLVRGLSVSVAGVPGSFQAADVSYEWYGPLPEPPA